MNLSVWTLLDGGLLLVGGSVVWALIRPPGEGCGPPLWTSSENWSRGLALRRSVSSRTEWSQYFFNWERVVTPYGKCSFDQKLLMAFVVLPHQCFLLLFLFFLFSFVLPLTLREQVCLPGHSLWVALSQGGITWAGQSSSLLCFRSVCHVHAAGWQGHWISVEGFSDGIWELFRVKLGCTHLRQFPRMFCEVHNCM